MIRWIPVAVALAILLFAVCLPSLGYAASIIPNAIVPSDCQGAGAAANCNVCDLAQLAQNLLNTAIYLAVIAAAVLFAWTGFKFLTAQDNSGARSAAKKMFWNVFIGLILIIGAWLIVNTIMSILVNGQPSWPWNQICQGYYQVSATGGQ